MQKIAGKNNSACPDNRVVVLLAAHAAEIKVLSSVALTSVLKLKPRQ